jgi:hypothetical protein
LNNLYHLAVKQLSLNTPAMPKFFTTVCCLFASVILFAQPYEKGTFSVSAGAELLPTQARLSATHTIGWGATVKGEYVFAKHASATIASGFYRLPGKTVAQVANLPLAGIPVKGGIRYYVGSFYLAGEAGLIFLTQYNKGTDFVYSAGAGDKIRLGRHTLDIGFRYELLPLPIDRTSGIFGIRVGYEFPVNERTDKGRAKY